MTGISSSSLVAVSVLPVIATGWTFQPSVSQWNSKTLLDRPSATRRKFVLQSKLFGPEEEGFLQDDFDPMPTFGAAENSGGGGAELAKDFFKELRQRDQMLKEPLPSDDNDNMSTNTDSQPNTKLSLTSNRNLVSSSSSDSPSLDPRNGSSADIPVIRRKFTGQPSDEARSFFARDAISSSSSSGQARTPREMMMEREYQLVRRAETGIIGQAIVAVLALAFYIYVGLSGGIVTGRDAQMGDWGGDDEIPFEQLMPVQRDREVSIWL